MQILPLISISIGLARAKKLESFEPRGTCQRCGLTGNRRGLGSLPPLLGILFKLDRWLSLTLAEIPGSCSERGGGGL